jgi:DnaJ-class molecular chaperone
MGGRRGHEEEPRTANVEIPLRVTLRQLYTGDILDTRYSRQVLCVEHSSCSKPCKDCQGPGIKIRQQQLAPGFVQQVQVCS